MTNPTATQHPPDAESLSTAIVEAIKDSRKAYIKMSGGIIKHWPESWVTACVAQNIAKQLKDKNVTMETPAHRIYSHHKTGRQFYDIAVWRNQTPYAVIEIKVRHRQMATTSARKDLVRLTDALNLNCKLEVGAFGFYHEELEENQPNEPSEKKRAQKIEKCRYRMQKRVNEMKKENNEFEVGFNCYTTPPETSDSWIAGCVLITRKA